MRDRSGSLRTAVYKSALPLDSVTHHVNIGMPGGRFKQLLPLLSSAAFLAYSSFILVCRNKQEYGCTSPANLHKVPVVNLYIPANSRNLRARLDLSLSNFAPKVATSAIARHLATEKCVLIINR